MHYLVTAGWTGSPPGQHPPAVQCVCTWHTEPGPGALEAFLDHLNDPDMEDLTDA